MDSASRNYEDEPANPEDVMEALKAAGRMAEASASMKGRVKGMTFEDVSGVCALYSVPRPVGFSRVGESTRSEPPQYTTSTPSTQKCTEDTSPTPTAQPVLHRTRSTRASAAKNTKDDQTSPIFTSLSAERAKPKIQRKALKKAIKGSTITPTTPTIPPRYPLLPGTPTRPIEDNSHTPGQLFYTSSPQGPQAENRISPGSLKSAAVVGSQANYTEDSFNYELRTPEFSDPSGDEADNDNYHDEDMVQLEHIEPSVRGSAVTASNIDYDGGDASDGEPMSIVDYNVSLKDLDLLQGGPDISDENYANINANDMETNSSEKNTVPHSRTERLPNYSDILISEAIDEIRINNPRSMITAPITSPTSAPSAPQATASDPDSGRPPLQRPQLGSARSIADKHSCHITTNIQGTPEEIIMKRTPALSMITENTESINTERVFISHPSNLQPATHRHTNRCESEDCGYVLRCSMNAIIEQSVSKAKKELETKIQSMDEMINSLDARYKRLERRGVANERNITDLRSTEPASKTGVRGDVGIKYIKMDGASASGQRSKAKIIIHKNRKQPAGSNSDDMLPSDGEAGVDDNSHTGKQRLNRTLASDGEETMRGAKLPVHKGNDDRQTPVHDAREIIKKRQIFRSPEKNKQGQPAHLNRTLSSDDTSTPVNYDARHKINANKKKRQTKETVHSQTKKYSHKRARSHSRSRSHSSDRSITMRRSKRDEFIDYTVTAHADGSKAVHGKKSVIEVIVETDKDRHHNVHDHTGEHVTSTRSKSDRHVKDVHSGRHVRLVESPEQSPRTRSSPSRRDLHSGGQSGFDDIHSDSSSPKHASGRTQEQDVDFDIDVGAINWNEFNW